jgi:cell wall-associated NlpC family hydrolase
MRRVTALCLTVALVAGFSAHADARTRSRHRVSSVPLILRPIVAARSAIHAAADPILFNAPNAVAAIATAPIRVAYQSARPAREEIYEGRLVDDAEDRAEPIEFAYNTNRVQRPHAPRAERVESLEENDDDEGPRQAEAAESQISGGAKPMVSGNRAVLRNGVAQAPSNAPTSVKNAIWAANSLRHKPYVWGGGHGSFDDRGYDCSGTVSFALHHAGVLDAPLPSDDLMHFGERGRGRWITIYTRRGHTFAVIAGLRLDTTDFYSGGNVGPRWHTDMRETFGYVARHPAGL